MIALRDGITLQDVGGVRVRLPEDRLSAADRKELVFWRTSPTQSPDSAFLDSMLVKALDIRHFDEVWTRLGLEPGMTCLEIGAGQAWASAMLQKRAPGAEVHASDVSPEALRVAARWGAAFETRLAGKWAFPSCDAPFADGQFDRIFLFAALHHLGTRNDFTAPLTEIRRLLKSSGRAIAFNEPVTPAYLYTRSFRGINQARQVQQGVDVDEDTLVISSVRHDARAAGLSLAVDPEAFPVYKETWWGGALRTELLRRVPSLGALATGGANFVFTPRI